MRYRSRLRPFSFKLAPVPESYEFIEIAHIGPYYGVVENNYKFSIESHEQVLRKSKNRGFLANFG